MGGACSDVQQNILQVSQYFKRDKLIEILHSTGNLMPVVHQRSQTCLALNLCLKVHGCMILLHVACFTRLVMKLEAEFGAAGF